MPYLTLMLQLGFLGKVHEPKKKRYNIENSAVSKRSPPSRAEELGFKWPELETPGEMLVTAAVRTKCQYEGRKNIFRT